MSETASALQMTGDTRGKLLASKPHLASFARLQWDAVRQKQVLLWPEGVLVLNDTAAVILPLCDHQQKVSEIIDQLSAQYHQDVTEDVIAFLNRLAEKRLVIFDE